MVRAAALLALNGIRRGVRNKTVILMGVVGPLVLGGVLALAFGGSGPQTSVAVVDLDGSPVSAQVVEGLEGAFGDAGGTGAEAQDRGDMSGLSVSGEPDVGSMAEARELVESGEFDSAVVIPSGYGDSVAAGFGAQTGTPRPLVAVTAADELVASAVAEAMARSVASSTDLRRAVASAVAGAGGDVAEVLSSDPQPVLRSERGTYSGDFDAPLFLGPLAVFLFLGLSVNAKSLVRDEHLGILDRVRSTPLSTWSVVAGSAAAVMVTGLLGATLVVVASSLVFDAAWGDPLDVAVVLVAFVASVAGLLGLVAGVASTEQQADSWTNLMAFGFAVIGGSFFGGALLPGVLGFIGMLTPNGAAMVALLDAGPGGEGLGGVWHLVVWMLLIGVLGVAGGGLLLRRRLR